MDEDRARQEAQARRQRILSSANNRMDRISGLQRHEEEDDNNDAAAAAAGASSQDAVDINDISAAASGDSSAGGGAAPAVETVSTTAEDEEGASKTSAAARKAKLAAMRRRRFKKPAAAAAAAAAPADSSTSQEEKESETEKATTAEQEATTTTSTTTTTTTVTETPAPASQAAATATPVVPIAASLSADKTDDDDDDEAAAASPKKTEGKKYMGVAKMRRKMIKEREAAKAKEGHTTSGGEGEDGITPSGTAMAAAAKKKKKSYYTHSLPILMEAVVVLLLFAVGLQVGLQQSHVEYTTILVHNGLTPSPREQGLRIVSYIPDKFAAWKNKGKTSSASKTLEQDSASARTTKPRGASEDEFAEIDDEDLDGEDNLDPLFGVDLDKLTNGPGVMLFLARYAVKLHRVLLYFFYYFPMRIYRAVASRVISMLDEPPLLCVAAILIRQFVGKTVLGARIPKQGEGGDDADGENTQDVIGTVKKVVMTFITGAFPTVVTLVEGWWSLRSDMYVVLFGLFVGWAWHHTDIAAITGSGDHLVNVHGDGTEDSVPAATGGTTDEL